jgi:hypothetical protein
MQWIFVTGMIRSGTTLVGKVLSLPWSVDYIHEPFNGGYSLPDKTPFEPRYIRSGATDPEAEAYRAHVQHIFSLDLGLNTTRHSDDSLKRKVVKALIGSRGPAYLKVAKHNPLQQAIVLKDPVAKLATPFLHEAFDVQPVVLVRHPVSLAASLDRMGWYPEMKDFTAEPHLVQEHFADEQAFLQRDWPSRLMEAMGHWRATYKVLLKEAERAGDWQVVTHEDLCDAPVATFQGLYEVLDLPWSARVRKKVQDLTGSRSSAEARGNQAMDLSRNSSALFALRRDSVPMEQRREIFDIVQDVALQVYSRESFAID